MSQIIMVMLHLVIGLMATMILLMLLLSIADFFRIVIFRAGLDRIKKPIFLICLTVSAVGGYYLTMSSYGVSVVGYASAFMLYH